MFADPDIHNPKEKYRVVDQYEWSITDQSEIGRLHIEWHDLTNHSVVPNQYKVRNITWPIFLNEKYV